MTEIGSERGETEKGDGVTEVGSEMREKQKGSEMIETQKRREI